MNFYEQLCYNWEKGYYSLVENKAGCFILFTTKYTLESFKGSCHYSTREKSINNQGESIYHKKYLEDNDNNLKIIETIHPSELMGEGFKVGDKVRIKELAKEECEKYGLGWNGLIDELIGATKEIEQLNGFEVIIKGYVFSPTALEPVMEKKTLEIEAKGKIPQKLKINGVEYNITKA